MPQLREEYVPPCFALLQGTSQKKLFVSQIILSRCCSCATPPPPGAAPRQLQLPLSPGFFISMPQPCPWSVWLTGWGGLPLLSCVHIGRHRVYPQVNNECAMSIWKSCKVSLTRTSTKLVGEVHVPGKEGRGGGGGLGGYYSDIISPKEKNAN